jgi:hypothetical protein
MSCSTTPLTQSQLQQLALNAGFPASVAPLMSAIALAESGGCPTATNPNDNNGTQTSWGLWQISNGTHSVLSGWNDAQTNANMAFQKYQSQGLRAWGSYTNGSYAQYLPGTSASVPPGVTPTASGSSNPITDLFNSDQVHQIGILGIGGVVILIGLVIAFKGGGS